MALATKFTFLHFSHSWKSRTHFSSSVVQAISPFFMISQKPTGVYEITPWNIISSSGLGLPGSWDVNSLKLPGSALDTLPACFSWPSWLYSFQFEEIFFLNRPDGVNTGVEEFCFLYGTFYTMTFPSSSCFFSFGKLSLNSFLQFSVS